MHLQGGGYGEGSPSKQAKKARQPSSLEFNLIGVFFTPYAKSVQHILDLPVCMKHDASTLEEGEKTTDRLGGEDLEEGVLQEGMKATGGCHSLIFSGSHSRGVRHPGKLKKRDATGDGKRACWSVGFCLSRPRAKTAILVDVPRRLCRDEGEEASFIGCMEGRR